MRQEKKERMRISEMREAIRRSGYLLEQRVKPVIEKAGYFVETNPAFPDPHRPEISREYDISGISALRISRRLDFIFPVLICECVNNPQPVVFSPLDSPASFLYHEAAKCSGIPVQFWDGTRFVRMSDFLGFERFHHYCKGPIATQYCTFQRKSHHKDWLAFHPDMQHEAFATLIGAVEAAIEEHYSNYEVPKKNEEERVNIQIYYPMLILQGDVYLASEDKQGLHFKKCGHVQYCKEIWTSKRRDTYHVDVITEHFLPKYLRLIEREAETIKNRMQRRRRAVRESIARLVQSARAVRKDKVRWRELLEP